MSTKRVVLGFVAVMVCANLTMTVQFARNDDRNRGRPGLIGWATGEKFQGIVADIALPELINKSHLRDAMMIGELSRVVDRLLEDRDDPVWIMSDLAGMVPYHVFTEHFGRVGFIDWYSITTRTPLSNCLPKYRVHRDLLGTYAQLEYYLDGKLAECGVPVPDLFFSAYSSERDMRDYRYRLDRMGFSVLHMQTGRITSPRSGRILSSTTPLYALIAVRKDLIPRVSDEVRGP